MSWMLGCVGREIPFAVRTRFDALRREALFEQVSPSFRLVAGGNAQTCLHSISTPADSDNPAKGWLVCGAGIRCTADHCYILTAHDWDAVLQSSQPKLRTLNGHFVAVRWNGASIEVFSDQLGLRKMYFAQKSWGLIFSTRLDWTAQLSGNSEIDYNVFGSSWLTYHQLSNECAVAGIRILGPGGQASLSPDAIKIESHEWIPDWTSAVTGEFEERLRAFSNPRGGFSSVLLSLSGGMDSRLLVSNLVHAKQQFACVTFGDEAHPDVKLARRIAADLGIAISHVDDTLPPSGELVSLLSAYAAEGDACEPVTSAVRLRWYTEMEEDGQMVIDGGFGELLRRKYFNRLYLKGPAFLSPSNASRIAASLSCLHANVFATEPQQQMQLGVERQLVQLLESMPDVHAIGPGNYLDLLAVRTRVPHWGSAEQARMDAHTLNYMPLVQPELLKSMFALPESSRKNGALVKQLIRRQTPRLALYPLASGQVVHPFGFGTYAARAWTMIASRIRRNTHIEPARDRILEAAKEFVLDISASAETRSYAPYDFASIDGLLHDYYAGDKRRGKELDWWLTFELWRRALKAVD